MVFPMREMKLVIVGNLLGGCGAMMVAYWCHVAGLGDLPTFAVGMLAGFSLAF